MQTSTNNMRQKKLSKPVSRKRVQYTISQPQDVQTFIEEGKKTGRFYNDSHAFELGIRCLKEREEILGKIRNTLDEILTDQHKLVERIDQLERKISNQR